MTKELEAFRDILGILSAVSGCEVDMDSERIKIVNQALQRLEQIDNANPSEALKDLEIIREAMLKYRNKVEEVKVKCIISPQFASIRQSLLKAQEQEKVLEIIKEKRVNVNQLLLCWKVEMYNSRCRKGYELSKEEFELLKRYLCQNE